MTMKTFFLGLLLGASLSAVATGPLPVLFTAHLIAHDAAGRTLTATAKGNSLAYSGAPTVAGSVLTLEYSTDSVLCSGFGG